MASQAAVDAARIEVERRRARLVDTAQELQQRLAPATLARDAWESAKIKGADLAEEAVDAVRARPVMLGSIAAAVMLFFAREPLGDLAGKAIGKVKRKTSKPAAKAASKSAPVSKAKPTVKRNSSLETTS